jgi:aminopeptidase-like protein
MNHKVEVDSAYSLAKSLWSIPRSITGDGIRDTLQIIKEVLPDLNIHEVKSGTNVFDWTIPLEWKVRKAFILDPSGVKICNFSENNLHLMGYSIPIDITLNLSELQKHLYSLPELPDAIPYITSYYADNWGFCISHNERLKLKKGEYRVVIESKKFEGSLTYGELLIPGKSKEEVFFSTYICHPSMANNELSGPVLTTFLAESIVNNLDRNLSYRIIFVPETIGSITYISKNLEIMKERIKYGFNITCVGDERAYSYLPSRMGDSVSDNIAKHILTNIDPNYIEYSWKDRGSDERQYCSPGVDLPVASLMRSMYGKYEEYHTSNDTLGSVVTKKGLADSLDMYKKLVYIVENMCHPLAKNYCEPFMSKRDLYPVISTRNSGKGDENILMETLTWCDGNHSIIDIAEKCSLPAWKVIPVINLLCELDLISK